MIKQTIVLGAVAVASVLGLIQSSAQDLPKTQPNFLTIYREQVKVGMADEHARHEAGWPAAFAKAHSTNYYLAMSSLTGKKEVLYVAAWKSHAQLGEDMKREHADPVLSSRMSKLAREDAKYVDSLSITQLRARPDLSLGEFPDLAKARFSQISVFRVRPGKAELFAKASKAYGAAAKRANPKASYRVYEVIAGMPTPTFITFTSVEDFAEFDQRMADDGATWQGATDEEKALISGFMTEGVIELETNRYEIDPKQSYVAEATKAIDPEFWNAK
jgi:hypothetical protein